MLLPAANYIFHFSIINLVDILKPLRDSNPRPLEHKNDTLQIEPSSSDLNQFDSICNFSQIVYFLDFIQIQFLFQQSCEY